MRTSWNDGKSYFAALGMITGGVAWVTPRMAITAETVNCWVRRKGTQRCGVCVCVCVCVWCAGIPFSVFEQRDHHLQNKARTILQHAVYLGLCGSTCEIRRLLHFREFKGHNAMRSVTPNKLLSPQEDRRQSVNRNANEDWCCDNEPCLTTLLCKMMWISVSIIPRIHIFFLSPNFLVETMMPETDPKGQRDKGCWWRRVQPCIVLYWTCDRIKWIARVCNLISPFRTASCQSNHNAWLRTPIRSPPKASVL